MSQSVLQAPTFRWSVAEYEKLGEAGIFHEDDRVELLNGEIIVMSPIGYRHHTTVRRLTNFFARRSNDRYEVDPQNPLTLDDGSQPQPDLVLLRPEIEEKEDQPDASDALLVIEVADSSLGYDRADKLPAYARAGVREVWIVNLQSGVFEIYRDPRGLTYHIRRQIERGESIAPLAFPDVLVPVSTILR